jgi:hypothetical protein
MTSFSSLLAYVASVAGMMLAIAVSYSAVFATPPGRPAIAPQAIVAAVAPSASQAAIKTADNAPQFAAPQFRAGLWGPAVVHSVAEGTGAGLATTAVVVRHNESATKMASREPRRQPLDLRASAKLWAYQPAPKPFNGALGYAEDSSDQSSRTW